MPSFSGALETAELKRRCLTEWVFACRPLLHAVVGGYATRAWGIEIDRVKCDKGNAFMRYAAAEMAKRKAAWGTFDVPAIRCAPIEDVRQFLIPGCHGLQTHYNGPADYNEQPGCSPWDRSSHRKCNEKVKMRF